jgi:hypothetical protein
MAIWSIIKLAVYEISLNSNKGSHLEVTAMLDYAKITLIS